MSAWDPAPDLERHLQAIVGERSPALAPGRLHEIEAMAERTFREAGLATWSEPIATSNGEFRNVIGDREAGGSPGKAPLFIVGAHIDAVKGTPGADDNASGAAALLALAGRYGPMERAGRATSIRFVAFNLEELGMVGSAEHAAALHATGREVAGMISLEMLGYVDARPGAQRFPPGIGFRRRPIGDFISIVGNLGSRGLVKGLADALRSAGLPVETAVLPAAIATLVGASLSDHSPFWSWGYRAVMIGDTAFYRNPNYHLATDTLETLSLPFLSKVTQGIGAYLETLP